MAHLAAVAAPVDDRVRFESQPQNSFRPAFAAGVVNVFDQAAKRQWLRHWFGFHRI
jgi:hypothetical protein